MYCSQTRHAVAAGVLLLLAAAPAAAQRGPARCLAGLNARGIDTTDVGTEACQVLATMLIDSLKARSMRSQVPSLEDHPRDLQSRASGNAGSAGVAGQSEAVPTVQPTTIAGGTLGALGSGGGNDGLVAVSLNPALFFPSGKASRDAAKSRIADITIVAPLGGADTASGDAIDYLGVRVRLNFVGIRQQRVLDRAESLFLDEVNKTDDLVRELTATLSDAPDLEQCTVLLEVDEAPAESELRASCGRAIDLTAVADLPTAFRRYTAQIRDSLDATYLGLDLRYDRGDPTFGEIAGLDGTFLFAGLAGGKRLVSRGDEGPSYGIRGRLGIQHITLDSGVVVDSVRTGTTFDAAIAFEASYPSTFRPMRLVGGFEFRSGERIATAFDEAMQRRSVQWRVSLDIPVTAANGISVSYATPLSGGGKPTLNVAFNWQLLLQEAAEKVRGR